MISLSNSTGAVGALASYLGQTGPGNAPVTNAGDEVQTLIKLVQGSAAPGDNLAMLLGPSPASTDSLGTLLGTSISSTDNLLVQISSLATALAAGGNTGGPSSSAPSPATPTPNTAASPVQIAKLLAGAYTTQQQGIMLLI
jgi:hypothetical protein